MKNILVVAMVVICMMGFSSCFHHHNLSVTIQDDADEYEMDASFAKRQTKMVQQYLNKNLLTYENGWYKNDLEDKAITIDDNTTFVIDASPGELTVWIDKNENPEHSYKRIKQVCQDIKNLLVENE